MSVRAAPVIPLSYSLHKAEQNLANALRAWWNDAQEALFGGPQPMVPAADWALGNEHFGDGSGLDFQVVFGWRGWTPDSDITYGASQINDQGDVQLPGASWLIDNRKGNTEVPFQRSVSVTYAQHATASLSVTIENDTKVGVKARVGNATSPAGLEGSIENSLKISGSKTDVSGWNQSRTETEQIGPVKVEPGHATLATIKSPQVRITQAMHVLGQIDTPITLSWLNVYPVGPRHDQGWDYRHWPSTDPATFVPAILGNSSRASDDGTRTTVKFDTVSEFVSFLQGYDTAVQGGLDRDNGSSHADAIINATNIIWDGTVVRTVQQASDYEFQDVAPDQVAATIEQQAISADRVVDLGS